MEIHRESLDMIKMHVFNRDTEIVEILCVLFSYVVKLRK